MDPLDTFRATAIELVSLARERGIDLEPFQNDFIFQKDRRWVYVWRRDSLPGTGPAHEPLGTLHYNMQGEISMLPGILEGSESAFREAWSEAGRFENLEQALDLLRAWLIDRKEVDDLPARSMTRYGI